MNTYTNTQNNQAEKIRTQYLSREENKFEQLKRLDSKVKTPGRVVSSTVGTIGALVMGAGMSAIMVVGFSTMGLTLGIAGMVVALAAIPLYSLITSSRKKKYAQEIILLSSQVAGA